MKYSVSVNWLNRLNLSALVILSWMKFFIAQTFLYLWEITRIIFLLDFRGDVGQWIFVFFVFPISLSHPKLRSTLGIIFDDLGFLFRNIQQPNSHQRQKFKYSEKMGVILVFRVIFVNLCELGVGVVMFLQ